MGSVSGVHNPEAITIDVKNVYIIPMLKMLAVDALVLEEIETRYIYIYNSTSIIVLVHRHESSE